MVFVFYILDIQNWYVAPKQRCATWPRTKSLKKNLKNCSDCLNFFQFVENYKNCHFQKRKSSDYTSGSKF